MATVAQTRFIPPKGTTIVTLTDAATIAVDCARLPMRGGILRVTLGGNRTLGNPTNMTDGQSWMLEIHQDGSGSKTLAYDTKYAFSTDLASPTLTTGANKVDLQQHIYNAAADKVWVISKNFGF